MCFLRSSPDVSSRLLGHQKTLSQTVEVSLQCSLNFPLPHIAHKQLPQEQSKDHNWKQKDTCKDMKFTTFPCFCIWGWLIGTIWRLNRGKATGLGGQSIVKGSQHDVKKTSVGIPKPSIYLVKRETWLSSSDWAGGWDSSVAHQMPTSSP